MFRNPFFIDFKELINPCRDEWNGTDSESVIIQTIAEHG